MSSLCVGVDGTVDTECVVWCGEGCEFWLSQGPAIIDCGMSGQATACVDFRGLHVPRRPYTPTVVPRQLGATPTPLPTRICSRSSQKLPLSATVFVPSGTSTSFDWLPAHQHLCMYKVRGPFRIFLLVQGHVQYVCLYCSILYSLYGMQVTVYQVATFNTSLSSTLEFTVCLEGSEYVWKSCLLEHGSTSLQFD